MNFSISKSWSNGAKLALLALALPGPARAELRLRAPAGAGAEVGAGAGGVPAAPSDDLVFSDLGVAACPVGTRMLTTEECEAAAPTFGYGFAGSRNKDIIPPGCVCLSNGVAPEDRGCQYNTNQAGVPRSAWFLACAPDDVPVPVPVPTPASDTGGLSCHVRESGQGFYARGTIKYVEGWKWISGDMEVDLDDLSEHDWISLVTDCGRQQGGYANPGLNRWCGMFGSGRCTNITPSNTLAAEDEAVEGAVGAPDRGIGEAAEELLGANDAAAGERL